jgi:hypothetical protein
MSAAAAKVVRAFWRLMGTNDFHAVGAVLADASVTDGSRSDRAISFFTVRDGNQIRGSES